MARVRHAALRVPKSLPPGSASPALLARSRSSNRRRPRAHSGHWQRWVASYSLAPGTPLRFAGLPVQGVWEAWLGVGWGEGIPSRTSPGAAARVWESRSETCPASASGAGIWEEKLEAAAGTPRPRPKLEGGSLGLGRGRGHHLACPFSLEVPKLGRFSDALSPLIGVCPPRPPGGRGRPCSAAPGQDPRGPREAIAADPESGLPPPSFSQPS